MVLAGDRKEVRGMKDYKSTVLYSGPDGAKRLEMLEELAVAVGHWRGVQDRLPRVFAALSAIDQDNERVSSELKR